MADGDSIQAGHITAAYTTTDVVAEQQREGLGGFGRKDFQGNVIIWPSRFRRRRRCRRRE
jgi:hypothetical protein